MYRHEPDYMYGPDIVWPLCWHQMNGLALLIYETAGGSLNRMV